MSLSVIKISNKLTFIFVVAEGGIFLLAEHSLERMLADSLVRPLPRLLELILAIPQEIDNLPVLLLEVRQFQGQFLLVLLVRDDCALQIFVVLAVVLGLGL